MERGVHPRSEVVVRTLERAATGQLTHETVTRIAAQLMTLNADGDDPITLHLDCADGDLDAALMTVEVTADVDAGRVLDAEDALRYGLVHEISHPGTRSGPDPD